jgi:hypothetical protein
VRLRLSRQKLKCLEELSGAQTQVTILSNDQMSRAPDA